MTTSNLLQTNDRIGSVVIEKRLGVGGQAQVYLGAVLAQGMKQPAADSLRIALKVIHYQDTGVLFDDEARHLSRVQRNNQTHPNLIHLLEWGTWQPLNGDTPRSESIHNEPVRFLRFMALEYLPGPTLEEYRLKSRRLPVLEVARIGCDLLSALSHVHDNGLMHLDVNPRNVLFRQPPPRQGWLSQMNESIQSAVLIDFGISRRLDDLVTMAPGWGAGGYASPEQYAESELQTLASPRCSPASDLFSLGVILYECLTGNNPYLTVNGADMRAYQPGFAPPRLIAQNATVPPAMERVILKCLQHDPKQRYPDARAALADWKQATHSIIAGQRRLVTFKKGLVAFLMAMMAILLCIGLSLGLSLVIPAITPEDATSTPRPVVTKRSVTPVLQTTKPLPPTPTSLVYPSTTPRATVIPSPTRPLPTRTPAPEATTAP